MKKTFFLAALMLVAFQALAGNIDLKTAQSKASEFLAGKAVNGRLMTSTPAIKWTHEVKNSSNASQVAYYIVNTDKGFVIIAGDDRSREILAYGDQPITDLNDLPNGLQYFLNIYQKGVEYLQAHPGMVVNKGIFTGGVSVAPMLQTAWAQGSPYNHECPKVGSTYCKVGCPAVSLGQVMRYWEYPTIAPALPAYKCKDSGIEVPALPEYTFAWDKMYDTYEGVDLERLPEENRDALAYFLRYVGQAETMDYNTDQSGAENLQILAALQTFGYDQGVHIVKKCDSPDSLEELENCEYTEEEYYNDEQWAEAIQAELRAGRPLVYCAYDMSSDSTSLGGHAFNVDGYDAENDMYHVNFGMSSSLNAYYALNNFTTDGWLTKYDFWPIFFAGVQPPGLSTDPRIFATPQELNMEAYTGETDTLTFNVASTHLTSDITVTLNDENNVFTADAATVALADSTGKTITVIYAPQAVGTHTATITLTSEGAEDVVVTLSGTATVAPLVVYDPVMLAADSAYINLTSFRADWTDQTASENVVSYTLEVNEKPASGGVLADVNWSNASGDATAALPEGWTVGDYSIFFDEGGIAITSDSYIKTDVLDLSGCEKVTVVLRAKNYYGWTNSILTVSTSVDSKTLEFTSEYTDYTVVLNCNESDQVTFYADEWNPTIQSIKIYSGEVAAPQLRATEEGDASHRTITGITDKFYTVSGLTEAGTYVYKVKALYTDGTESAWSNNQTITLFENGPAPHGYDLGDVNHDNQIDVDDVTLLIGMILGNSSNGCTTCADVNGDTGIDVDDVTLLIGIILGNN